MIVPLFSPDNVDLTTWVAQCDRCGLQQPIDKIVDWTVLAEEEADVHYCPACTKRIARYLIDSATPRRSRLGLALTALIAIGTLADQSRRRIR